MVRTVISLMVGCTLALANAHAVPARRPHEPDPPAPTIPDLRGTTWSGWNDAIKAPWVVIFEADGTFNNSYNNNTYRTGSWKQAGNTLYYETNGKYAEFRGAIQGNTIVGQAWNVNGLRWQILLNRVPASK